MPRTVLVAPVPNRDITAASRTSLTGHWSGAVLVTLVIALLLLGGGWWDEHFIYLTGVSAIVLGAVYLGCCRFLLERVRGGEYRLAALTIGFRRIGVIVLAYALAGFWVIISLLCLVVPGILAALSCAMLPFILIDEPQCGPISAIERSRRIMYGHRWQFVRLMLRFVGWWLLGAVSFGIGFIWIWPYWLTSTACFYDRIRPSCPVAEPEPAALVELTPVTETVPVVGPAPLMPNIPEATGAELPPRPFRGFSPLVSVLIAALAILLMAEPGRARVLRGRVQLCSQEMQNAVQDGDFAATPCCPESGRPYLNLSAGAARMPLDARARRIDCLELPGNHFRGNFNVITADREAHTLRLEKATPDQFIALLQKHYDLDPRQIQIIRDVWPAQ